MNIQFIERVPAVREVAKKAIIRTLRFHHGNRQRAAADLGMHRNTLQRLILRLEINVRDFPDGRSVHP